MGRLIGCLAVIALAFACQAQPQPSPTPSPVPTPHTAPLAAVLQAADVPAGLAGCTGSGPIDTYISSVAATNPSVAAAATAEWAKLQTEGATAAAVSIFAADPSACGAELGAASNFKSAASFVAIFSDAGEADRAWGSGLFGFVPPAVGEQAPGVTRGASTGLGISSFTYVLSPVQLAAWHHSVFVALVVLTNLDTTAFQPATAAVDARLN